jgi:hypothetical protein
MPKQIQNNELLQKIVLCIKEIRKAKTLLLRYFILTLEFIWQELNKENRIFQLLLLPKFVNTSKLI